MFIPAAFAMPQEMQAKLLHTVATANLVTPDLAATLIPYVYDPHAHSLKMHLHKHNPQCNHSYDSEALAIINGPAGYISASFYPGKKEHGRVVPTWDYTSLHVYGDLIIYKDRQWILEQVSALTAKMESQRELPWSVSDAPEDYIQALLDHIVGVELKITRIEAQAKLSQNKSRHDQLNIIAGVRADSQEALARAIMETMPHSDDNFYN